MPSKHNNDLGAIEPPILILAPSHDIFTSFWRKSGFQAEEVKYISSLKDIQGFKDKTMMIVGYVANVVGLEHILDYAKQHNIRMVKT